MCSVRSVSECVVAFATPKSMIFGTGWSSWSVDQDVRRLQVAMDDALLMGMLHGVADLDEQLEALAESTACGASQYS